MFSLVAASRDCMLDRQDTMPSVRLKIEVVGTDNDRFAALPFSGAPRVITHRTAEGRRTASVRAYTPPRLQPITLTLPFDVAAR